MKCPLWFLCVLMVLPMALSGQNFRLTGQVRDARHEALPFANVILLQVRDSAQIKGVSSDEAGRFVLPEVPSGVYYLQARYFGFESYLVAIEVQRDLDMGTIVMAQDSEYLEEVVLYANKPRVERLPDRIVFQVANSVLSQGSTWDILRNTPGVIMAQDIPEIRGQRATFYLNGRKVQLDAQEVQDLLQGLGGDAVEAIEVIPNPPASFDAEDGPVLNIRTHNNVAIGYKGSATAAYTQGILPKFRFGTSHYYKNKDVELFANYSIRPERLVTQYDAFINFINPQGQEFANWDLDWDAQTRALSHQGTVIADFKLSGKDALNVTANLSTTPDKQRDVDVFTRMENGQGVLDSTLQSRTMTTETPLNFSADLSYERKFKKEGSSLRLNGHYTRYQLEKAQQGTTDYFDASGSFLRDFGFAVDADQEIDIITGQADYTYPFGKGNFESGVKYSNIQSINTIDYFNVNNQLPPFDIDLTDEFQYDEEVWAAYANINQDWDSWSLSLGLRAEQTDVVGTSTTLNEITNQSYLRFFPSINLNKKLGEQHSTTLSYNRSITRPRYSTLNPFRFFLNENDFDEGNPNLVPNLTHNFNLNFSFSDTYFLDFYYRDNGAYISSLSFQDNQAQTIRQIYQNALESKSYGIDFTVATSLTPFWYVYLYQSAFYEDEVFLAVESDIESFKNDVTGYYVSLSNSLTLSKDGTFQGELSFVYYTGFLYGSYVLDESMLLNAGLRKTFWDNRAVLSLQAEDILGRFNNWYRSVYANQNNGTLAVPETQFVRLGLTVNFGNYRLSNQSRETSKSELDRLDND